MQIGSLRVKRNTSLLMVITFYSSLLYMVDEENRQSAGGKDHRIVSYPASRGSVRHFPERCTTATSSTFIIEAHRCSMPQG
jgi:hypothetical protein